MCVCLQSWETNPGSANRHRTPTYNVPCVGTHFLMCHPRRFPGARSRRIFMLPRAFVACFALFLTLPALADAQEKKRSKLPNIIWISSEDHGPHLGCYGDKFARTPN